MRKTIFLFGLSSILFFTLGCNSLQRTINDFNAFTPAQDKELGLQVAADIASKPSEYPILPEAGNEKIYAYIRGLASQIVNSGQLKHKDLFSWKVLIIKDNKTLNAFCTPGGHIYVYTGLIKFLDSEDQLLGVLGHEMAHADLRHSTAQLTKQYGISILGDALLGSKGAIGQITTAVVGGIAGLKFSRISETEADEASVKYLCNTKYNAAGAAGFFKKIEGQSQSAEWLSTHPNPTNRIKNIEDREKALGCSGSNTNTSEYSKMKALLP